MQTEIHIELPESFPIKIETFSKLQELNPEVNLELKESGLRITEKDFSFSETDFFKLNLPCKIVEGDIGAISDLNEDLRMEFDEGAIIINMGTVEFIGAFAVAIIGTMYLWNKKMKLGRILDSATGHDMEIDGKKIHRMPDIAFHLHDKFKQKVYNKTSRAGAPFFCIEIVSSKNSLNQELQKMENDWMGGGVEIGLVVCPFGEEYYQFEKDISGYSTHSFSYIFSHPSLPELSLNFISLLNEAMEEIEK